MTARPSVVQPSLFPHVQPYTVTTQSDLSDRWMWWLNAPNNATVARSARKYTTQVGAEKAALKVLKALTTNGIQVVRR